MTIIKEINQLKQRLAELEAKALQTKQSTWMPEKDQLYYFLSHENIGAYLFNDDSGTDGEVLKRQDPFKTEEEAIKADQQRMAIVEANRQARALCAEQYPDWVCDWGDDNQYKWYPVYGHQEKCVFFTFANCRQEQWTFDHLPCDIWRQVDEELLKKAMGVA